MRLTDLSTASFSGQTGLSDPTSRQSGLSLLKNIRAPRLYGSSVVVMIRPLVDGLGTPVVPTISIFFLGFLLSCATVGGLSPSSFSFDF